MGNTSNVSEPAQVDLLSKREIIQHIRALLDLSELLERGFDAEIADFIELLKAAGWGKDQVSQFISSGACGTRYEQQLPSMFPERGDRTEWEKNKAHWKK